MLLTLNQVISQITTLAAAHSQITASGVGDFAEWQAEERSYPLLWVFHETTSVGGRELVFSIRLICADRVIVGQEGEDTDGMEQEVLSDTMLILLDFLSYFMQQHSQTYTVVPNATIDPFTERLNDRLAGNSVIIQIRQPFTWNACQIPQSGATIPPTVDGLTLYDFCDPSVIARLTPAQVACLEAEYGIPCADGNIEINSTPVATVPSGGIEDIVVRNIGGGQVGSLDGADWEIANSPITRNGISIDSVKAEDTFAFNTKLDGVANDGTYNSGTKTLAFTSAPCAPVTFQINGVTKETPAAGSTFNLITKLDGVVNSGSYDAPTDTLSFTSNSGWVRPSDWIAIPDLTAADERFYGVVAVFENAYNQISAQITNLAANINWGDGSSVVSNNAVQTKVYDYASLLGMVYVWPDGRNYKQVLIDITRVGGAIARVTFFNTPTINGRGGNNFIDINCSLPSLTTYEFAGDAASGVRPMPLLQRLRIWDRPNHSASGITIGMRNLQSLTYPVNKITNGNNFSVNVPISLSVADTTFTIATTIQSFWEGTRIKTHGNLVANSVTGAGLAYYCNNALVLTSFGTITATSATSLLGFFSNNYLLTSVGLITVNSCTSVNSLFSNCYSLQGATFTDCASVTDTASLVANASSLYYLVMPNLTRGVNFTHTAMGNYGMNLFANSIGTASGAQTITATGTPFGALVTAGDATALAIRAVITGKGYTYTN